MKKKFLIILSGLFIVSVISFAVINPITGVCSDCQKKYKGCTEKQCNYKIKYGDFMKAVMDNNIPLASHLLRLGYPSRVNDNGGYLHDPLIESIHRNYRNMTLFLLNEKADVIKLDKNGHSPLHHAVNFYKNISIVKRLVELGAEIDRGNEYGVESPLDIARKHGPSDILLFLEKEHQKKVAQGTTKCLPAPTEIESTCPITCTIL